MIHSDNEYFLEESKTIRKKKHSPHLIQDYSNKSDELISLIIQGKYQITASTTLFKKELFNKYFDIQEIKTNGFLMEDTPFWIEVANISNIYYLTESLATYRIHHNSMSQSVDMRKKLVFKKNNSEMCLHYCHKFRVPDYITKIHEKIWRNTTLQIAFIEQTPSLAEQVKKQYPKLSLKESIWYHGSTAPFMRPFVIILAKLFQRKKLHTPWI